MSLEWLEGRPDLVDFIYSKNKEQRENGQRHSPYTTLALAIMEGGRVSNKSKNKRERELAWIRDRSAIMFGLAHLAIEQALSDGTFDYGFISSRYNETVMGTRFGKLPEADVEVEDIPEEDLRIMREYHDKDKTWSIFFTDEKAYRSLPESLVTLFAYLDRNARQNAEAHIIPFYSRIAERIPPPILMQNLTALYLPSKEESETIFKKLTADWNPQDPS